MNKFTSSYLRFTGICILAFSLFASSCKKDKKEDPPKELTKKELLSNSWKVTDILAPGNISIINQDFDQIKCFKDNIFTLKSDNSYTIEEGAVVCSNSYESAGTWSLTENDTLIKFTPTSGNGLSITLISVDQTTLKASYNFADAPIPGTYTVILQKK